MAETLDIDFDLLRSSMIERGPSGAMRVLARNAPFSEDASWAGEARWVDARMCVVRSTENFKVQPLAIGCSGDPICQYGFYAIEAECTPEIFARTMFQLERYLWAQEQAQRLLREKPTTKTAADSQAWASWCREAMRLYSLGRWSSNIASTWLVDGPIFARTLQEIEAHRPGPADTEGPPWWDGLGVPSLWMPRDRNNLDQRHIGRRKEPAPPGIPVTSMDFEPMSRAVQPARDAAVLAVHLRDGRGLIPWPSALNTASGRSRPIGGYSSSVHEQMVRWFAATLGGDLWRSATMPIDTTVGVGGSGVQRGQVWIGSGDATIRLCEAWLRDLVATPYNILVGEGLGRFIARLEALPPEMQAMTLERMGMTAGQAVTELKNMTLMVMNLAMGTVAGAAAAIPIVGWIVSLVTLVLQALISLMLAFGSAYGGGDLAAACLTSPVVRMVLERSGTPACDFDVRPGTDAAKLIEAVVRVDTVRAAALRGDTLLGWYQASERAGASMNPSDLAYSGRDLDAGGSSSSKAWWLGGGAAAALILGAAIYKKRG